MFASIIAALGMCADGVAEGLYALRHRFSPRAAGIGYAIGAVVAWLYDAVTPITFTVESITIATREAKKPPQILYIVALSAVPSIILGATGLYSEFVGLLDRSVVAGVIAGVGIILARVGFGYISERPWLAGLATLTGVAAYALTQNLVYVIVASIVTGTAVEWIGFKWLGMGGQGDSEGAERQAESDEESGEESSAESEQETARFGLMVLKWNELVSWPVLVGAFSVFALRTGAVVSYATVNAQVAGGRDPTLDGATLMAGLGTFASALLGGPPVETTPAPMAAAPMPVFSTALFMGLMAAITLLGLVRRLGKFIPLQAIAGFLIVLGIPVVLPEQMPLAAQAPLAGGTALAVTALSNPFYGLLAGQAVLLGARMFS
jgi:AGZA family xanthine/uracil permease-like MFS transporter